MSLVKWLLEKPARTSKVAAVLGLPFTYLIAREISPSDDVVSFMSKALGGASVPMIFAAASGGVADYFRVRLLGGYSARPLVEGDSERVSVLRQQVNSVEPPSFASRVGEPVTFGRSFGDYLFLYYGLSDANRTRERALRKSSPSLLFNAASKFFHEKEFDLGLLCIRDALNIVGDRPVRLSFENKCRWWVLDRLPKQRDVSPLEVENYFARAASLLLVDPVESWRFSSLAKRIADEFESPARKEVYVFDALLASFSNRSDVGVAWSDALNVVSRECPVERVGESRNLVQRIGGSEFLSRSILLKRSDDGGSLVAERDNLRALGGLGLSADVPRILDISKTDSGEFVSVVSVLDGVTAFDVVSKEDYSVLDGLVDLLSDIHLKYRPQFGRVDLLGKLQSKLLYEPLGAVDMANSVVSASAPLVRLFDSASWVWNKDAHLRNWIVGDRVGVIDCEATYLVPASHDVVNLLECDQLVPEHIKHSIISRYAGSVGVSVDEFSRFYFASLPLRAVDWASAWSDPQRISLRSERGLILNRGIWGLDVLKGVDGSFYRASNLDSLRDSLYRVLDRLI